MGTRMLQCLHLEVNLKKKSYLYVNSTTQTKYLKLISLKLFSFAVVLLELRIFLRIFDKFETALMGYSGAWGKLIHEKSLKSKIS
jgi:hypothetical protein